jgi:hypothetical protein
MAAGKCPWVPFSFPYDVYTMMKLQVESYGIACRVVVVKEKVVGWSTFSLLDPRVPDLGPTLSIHLSTYYFLPLEA